MPSSPLKDSPATVVAVVVEVATAARPSTPAAVAPSKHAWIATHPSPQDPSGGARPARAPPRPARSALRDDVAVCGEAAVLAVAKVGGLDSADAVAVESGVPLDLVVPGAVAAQDRGFDRAVGRPERGEAVLSLH